VNRVGEMERAALESRNEALEAALREANETLDAIRNGEVDAVVVGGADGQVVYTLENADRPYRVLVEQMREGAVTLSGDATILYSNRSFAAFVGLRTEEIVGHSFFEFIEDRAGLERLLADAGAGRSEELAIVARDGRRAPSNLSIVELVVEPGQDRMLCGIVTDLTQNYERTRAEQSLAIALDAADMGSWDLTVGQDGGAVRSSRHDTIYGYDQPAPRWTLTETLSHYLPEEREEVSAAFREALATGRLEFEKRIRRAGDGALRWVHVKGRTFYRDGRPERIAGIILDNTDRRLIEEQLRQGQKMEAIGQLTGGIAHDFNNLLMIIGGSLEALSRRVQLDDRVQRLLDAARLGVARGAKLNEQLLAFARRQDMREEAVCLNDLLPTFATLLDRAIGEGVKVEIREGADLWSCRTDPHQLEAAILNLAINGRDAMQNSGVLLVTTANASISAVEAERRQAMAGDYVALSVADTGSGMDPEIAAHVFEPFFTTKDLGKGTGLGLSQVYGFARQSGGFVALESVVGYGTTVSIYLPRTGTSDEALTQDRVAAPQTKADGDVLLVEDDADVRAATAAMLEELGYGVVEAGSAQDALDVLHEGRRIDIVFSDVIMGHGMTGIELARAVEADYPELPVLLTSGYTAQRMTPAAMNSDLPLLRKPYTLSELADAFTKVLGAKDLDAKDLGGGERH
jgi:PAS domain S-box-containing protein